jgi:hypothetical protein
MALLKNSAVGGSKASRVFGLSHHPTPIAPAPSRLDPQREFHSSVALRNT